MKKFSVVFFLTFLILDSPQGWSQQETPAQASWFSLWEKAKALEDKGSLQEARKAYESLLKQENLGGRASSIRKE